MALTTKLAVNRSLLQVTLSATHPQLFIEQLCAHTCMIVCAQLRLAESYSACNEQLLHHDKVDMLSNLRDSSVVPAACTRCGCCSAVRASANALQRLLELRTLAHRAEAV